MNRLEGQKQYAEGDAETRAWFEKQWVMWPDRADENFTTNLSFHYGGVQAYRLEHDKDPVVSEDFAENITYLDRRSA